MSRAREASLKLGGNGDPQSGTAHGSGSPRKRIPEIKFAVPYAASSVRAVPELPGVPVLEACPRSESGGPIHDAPTEPHWACKGRRFWKSVRGVYVCATCHSPADPALIAEWVEVTA